MLSADEIKNVFEDYLNNHQFTAKPASLYEPVNYIISLKAKRARPVLLLLAYQLFNNDIENGLSAAMAVEIFHNFTLLHDDIMDNADLRRGQSTVHVKFGQNKAILSGDVMLILSQQLLNNIDHQNKQVILEVFNKVAVEICEGQQMDMDFESTDNVGIDDYLEMIRKKTAVLLGVSMQIGALLGGATTAQANSLYKFGEQFGVSFQIQDDYLDSFGDTKQIGKQIGGDIRQGKKTYLYLKALELLAANDLEIFKNLYGSDTEAKVENVLQLFRSNGIDEYTIQLRDAYHDLAFGHLDMLDITGPALDNFKFYCNSFIKRKS